MARLPQKKLKVVDQQETRRPGTSGGNWAARFPAGLEEMGGELFGREVDGPRGRPSSCAADQIPSSKCVLPTPVGPWITSGENFPAAGQSSRPRSGPIGCTPR